MLFTLLFFGAFVCLPMSINPILSETTLEFMLGQDEIFVRAKIQREFEYFDELNIIHNERSEF